MIRVLHNGGPLYGIVGPYDTRVRDIAHSIPGLQWSKQNRAWVGYIDAVSECCKQAAAAGIQVDSAQLLKPSTNDLLAIDCEKLRDYQKTGVEFLVANAYAGCILADEMALGKTAQAIRAAKVWRTKTIVVCPSFVKGVWSSELSKWWPEAKSMQLKTTKPTPIPDDIDVAIINFDILYAWLSALTVWNSDTSDALRYSTNKTLVIDELHYLMGSDSRRTKAARSLARNCFYRIGLTGTPKPSHVKDLWAPLDVLSESRFGKFFDFARAYCGAKQETIEIFSEGVRVPRTIWKPNGSSREDELKERLSFLMLRRTKADVAIELPAVTRQIVELDVKWKPKKFDFPSDAALRKALDVAADLKIPQVIEMVSGYAADAKVVVFSYRRAVAQAIADGVKSKLSGKTVRVVTGDLSQEKRQAVVAEKPDVLCCTMDSLGVGISLAYASIAVFAELHYVPSTLMQCEGRLPRPDSKAANVLIVYAIARGTADELIRRVVISKMAVDQKVVGKAASTLFDDLLNKNESAASKLKRLYERILAEEGG